MCELTEKEQATLKIFLAKKAKKYKNIERKNAAVTKMGETNGIPDWFNEFYSALEDTCPVCNKTGLYTPGFWIFKGTTILCPRCQGTLKYVGRKENSDK